MSYSSRVYRQRNPKPKEDSKEEGFFSRQHTEKQGSRKNAFFQQGSAAPAGAVQKLATPAEDEKLGTNDARMKKDKEIQEKPIQRKGGEPDKEKKGVQLKVDDKKEEEPAVQKKGEPEKKEAQLKASENKEEEPAVQKKDEPEKKEVQKKDSPKKEDDLTSANKSTS